jgi:hypothetical protein
VARKLFGNLGLFVTFCVVALILRDAPMPWGDGRFYFEMAAHPGTFVGSPYGYRIGVPYLAAALASLTDSDLYSAFGLVQIGTFATFMTLMFHWVSRGLGLGRLVAALASLLCVLSPAGLYNLRNPFVVGFAEYLLLLLGCMAIYHR